jgi:hypothetical protein
VKNASVESDADFRPGADVTQLPVLSLSKISRISREILNEHVVARPIAVPPL